MRLTPVLSTLLCLLVTSYSAGQDTDDSLGADKAADPRATEIVLQSPATGGDEEQSLETTNDLVTQAGNTTMTPGVCLVVDALVMEFCNANPNDISCQFR